MLVGVLLALAASLRFGAAPWVEAGAIDGAATTVLGLLFLLAWGGLADVLLATFTPLPIALVILFVYGINTSAGMVVFNATLQSVIPEAVRDRVFTLLNMTWNAMRLLSLAIGGLMVDQIGIQPCTGRMG